MKYHVNLDVGTDMSVWWWGVGQKLEMKMEYKDERKDCEAAIKKKRAYGDGGNKNGGWAENESWGDDDKGDE